MTNNIKAQVFAIYIYMNQKVLCGPDYSHRILTPLKLVTIWYGDYLLLRSISMLKDDEIENFCKMAGYLSTDTIEDWREQYESLVVDPELDEVTWKQVDYLRTIGVCVPITVLIDGKPTTFTVADLEREGVIKIVEG